jgi:hypothetical protein
MYSHLSQVRGHINQPSNFWSSSSSCCIQLSIHPFWDCGVLHSFYMTKPSYSLAFNKLDNVLPLNYGFVEFSIIRFLSPTTGNRYMKSSIQMDHKLHHTPYIHVTGNRYMKSSIQMDHRLHHTPYIHVTCLNYINRFVFTNTYGNP